MKLRNHICCAALLGVALAFLFTGTNALGQVLQPPFMAPTPPSLMYGAFYFSAGAKYRNLQTFTMNVLGGPSSIVVAPGTIPFGPTTAGPFGVGTGKLGFDGLSGNLASPDGGFSWVYDNGIVSGDVIPGTETIIGPGPFDLSPQLANTCTTGAPPVTTICNRDQIWFYSVVEPVIGRFVTTVSGGCCTGQASSSLGSFVIDDPTTQVNNLGSMTATTLVTFSFALTDSLAFLTNTGGNERVFQGAVVGPALELGYQFSNYFDLFYGFSWFTTSNSMTLSTVIQGQGAKTTIVDTFPFVSDDPAAWPISLGAFQSSNSINLGSTQFQNYHIATNSQLLGISPTRQFSSVTDASIPTENIQATLSNSAEFTPLENRFGARSWAPLWGLGRIGAILGGAVIPTHFKITGSNSFVATGTSGAVAPGTVLSAQTLSQDNWRTLYGGFVGGDLMLGNTGYFLYGSADYMWASSVNYDLGPVTTIFNPGGFTAGFSGGIQF